MTQLRVETFAPYPVPEPPHASPDPLGQVSTSPGSFQDLFERAKFAAPPADRPSSPANIAQSSDPPPPPFGDPSLRATDEGDHSGLRPAEEIAPEDETSNTDRASANQSEKAGTESHGIPSGDDLQRGTTELHEGRGTTEPNEGSEKSSSNGEARNKESDDEVSEVAVGAVRGSPDMAAIDFQLAKVGNSTTDDSTTTQPQYEDPPTGSDSPRTKKASPPPEKVRLPSPPSTDRQTTEQNNGVVRREAVAEKTFEELPDLHGSDPSGEAEPVEETSHGPVSDSGMSDKGAAVASESKPDEGEPALWKDPVVSRRPKSARPRIQHQAEQSGQVAGTDQRAALSEEPGQAPRLPSSPPHSRERASEPVSFFHKFSVSAAPQPDGASTRPLAEIAADAQNPPKSDTPTEPGARPDALPLERPSHQPVSRSSSPPADGEAPGSDQLDRVRFAHRVARAFESIGDRGGTVRLRLHPPELGSLRVEVTVRAGAMTARLEAETAAAKSLLLESLPALRDRLGEQNIRVERFDVDLADRSAGGSDDRFRGDAGPRDHHHRQSQSPQPAGGEAATGDVAGRRGLFPYAVPGRLDVII